MKYFELNKEEQQLLEEFEAGTLVSIPGLNKEKAKYQKIASTAFNKTKNINVRLSEKDLQKLKAKAAESGIPYQTLVSSILHRLANS